MFKRYREAAAAAALGDPGPAAADSSAPLLVKPHRADDADDRFLIGRNRYGRYAVPLELSLRLPARQILRGGVWDGDTVDFLRRVAGQGDVALAGASFGPFIPPLADALAPGCLLWAFEPNPSVFAAAEETARLNNLGAVELHDVGLGDGESIGYMPDPAAARPGAEMLVSIARADAVIAPKRPVAAIHFGFSAGLAEALAGARRLIASRKPLLLLERPVSAQWLAASVCGGYRQTGRVGRSLIYRCG